jgi:Zinc-ribbon containing domain
MLSLVIRQKTKKSSFNCLVKQNKNMRGKKNVKINGFSALYGIVVYIGGTSMGIKYSSKINKIRTFALSLIFVGIFVMYIGIFFRTSPLVMTLFMILGLLFIIASSIVYFWIGTLSTRAVQVVCPSCGKVTKMLGKVDLCMFCSEPLTLDPELEGKEFDEKYNKKRKS